ncbi:hypothetical protein [Fodinicola acaciae]|uniref:hypothetical protein n=1 Tax=Fodinicola acaciae TaxID=2681555 RepID=UPI0013CFE22E|nr:hypothetical protein [Fodinicola acaciae]
MRGYREWLGDDKPGKEERREELKAMQSDYGAVCDDVRALVHFVRDLHDELHTGPFKFCEYAHCQYAAEKAEEYAA